VAGNIAQAFVTVQTSVMSTRKLFKCRTKFLPFKLIDSLIPTIRTAFDELSERIECDNERRASRIIELLPGG
jgi:hypothetical protein